VSGDQRIRQTPIPRRSVKSGPRPEVVPDEDGRGSDTERSKFPEFSTKFPGRRFYGALLVWHALVSPDVAGVAKGVQGRAGSDRVGRVNRAVVGVGAELEVAYVLAVVCWVT
jgi:hypothetical protein